MRGMEGWLDVKKKTVVKILLDILMLAVTALMYSSHALGLQFHEVGGLALIGVFFIHKGLNLEWIRRVTVRLFRVDGRTRLKWILDALLLLGFLTVGVSGILISKVAFPGVAARGGPWKALHFGSAALSLILVGVHTGLHLDFLKGVLSRWVRLPRVVAAVLTVAVMAYGVYGLATTSFIGWLSMPFRVGGGPGFHDGKGGDGAGDRVGRFPGGNEFSDANPDDASNQVLADGSASARFPVNASVPTQTIEGSTSDSGSEAGTSARSRYGKPGGRGGKGPGGRESQGSIAGALSTLAQFASIAFLFAALTAFLDIALRRKKRRALA